MATTYTAFTITKGKEKDSYRIWADHRSSGGWEGGETYADLVPVSGVLVAMRFGTRPIAVFKDLDHCVKSLEKQYGVTPVISSK